MLVDRASNPVEWRSVRFEDGNHPRLKQVERPTEDQPKQVVLAGDVVVQAAAIHPERLAEVLHARRVEPALPEESRRRGEQLRFAWPRVRWWCRDCQLAAHSTSRFAKRTFDWGRLGRSLEHVNERRAPGARTLNIWRSPVTNGSASAGE